MSIDKATITATFHMPPEEIVELLRSKGLQVSDSWMDLWQTAHNRAFTVARTAGYDVLSDIREALVKGMNEGISYQQFTENLKPILQAKGWWGKAIDMETGEIVQQYESGRPVMLGSPRRLRLIYEQNVQTAMMAGRYRSMMGAVKTHPYWQYVAIMDENTRTGHASLNGKVFRADDSIWSVIYPPNGWRCRCRVRPMTAGAVQRAGLSVGSSDGYIREIELPQHNGTTVKVKQVALPYLDKPFQPDIGWDYNPAIGYYRDAA